MIDSNAVRLDSVKATTATMTCELDMARSPFSLDLPEKPGRFAKLWQNDLERLLARVFRLGVHPQRFGRYKVRFQLDAGSCRRPSRAKPDKMIPTHKARSVYPDHCSTQAVRARTCDRRRVRVARVVSMKKQLRVSVLIPYSAPSTTQ